MSILAAFTPTTNPSSAELALTLVTLILIVAAPIVALRLGVFRRRSIEGPVRLGSDMPVTPFVMVTLTSAVVWIMSQAIYGSVRAAAYVHAHPGQHFEMSKFTGGDFAFISIVPPAIGLLFIIIGDTMLRGRVRQALGYSRQNVGSGVGKAILAMFVVVPLITLASMPLDWFYHAIHFDHPGEHELLGAMKDVPTYIRVLLVIGACVCAPVFEEFLFRGHLQTMLVRLFAPLFTPRAQISAPPAPTLDSESAAEPVPPVIVATTPVEPPSVGVRWLAVLITSLIFAGVHPLWMAPLIFVLSLCLGYAYERTGNLWVTIAMHALFNIYNTLIFLNFR